METSLVARAAELDHARRAIRSGSGAVIVGEAGVGKTALAAAVAAGERPAAWIIATAAARLTPFGALAPLLPADAHTVHPAMVPQCAARRLRETSGANPLLVVDDAQLLDEHSAAVLLALVTAGDTRVLATVRAGAPTSDAVRALWKDRLLDRIDLGPLDRVGTRALLAARLDGEVAATAAELLWRHSGGNPLYLTELVRFGVDTGRLRRESGVWWWYGGTEVPPRLDELLGYRLDELTPDGRQAVELLALGEPLPYDTLASVVRPDALLELDERALVTSDTRDGVVLLRFAHPLVHAVAEHRLTPARRRHLAERLRRAPATGVDIVRRAAWEEAAGGEPDVALLLAAADRVFLSEPDTAARFAARAARHDPGPGAAVSLSAARAELGDTRGARAALALAAARVRDDHERLAVGFEYVSLAAWSDRDPVTAAALLDRLRADLPTGFVDELDSAAAFGALFRAEPARALATADAVLARRPSHSVRVRALTVRMTALALADRPDEAVAAGGELLAALRERPVNATRTGLAHALVALTYQLCGRDADLPRAHGLSGRWPARPDSAGRDDVSPAWPLLEGIRRYLEGDHAAAVTALREAHVQQQIGEGLFRSEAVAFLIAVLAESGATSEAARLLDSHPPDPIAVVPGLLGWARAALAAASGRATEAGELSLAAARQAAAAGAPAVALGYLADAARHGAARAALAEADRLPEPRSDLARARRAGLAARASGDPDRLLDAAERHLALGLSGPAADLAAQALARAGTGRAAAARATRAGAVLDRLGRPRGAAAPPDRAADAGLTRRELEISRMAAEGLSDRDIAAALVVSVRTVESHLSTAYRKLGIGSRRMLGAALGGGG